MNALLIFLAGYFGSAALRANVEAGTRAGLRDQSVCEDTESKEAAKKQWGCPIIGLVIFIASLAITLFWYLVNFVVVDVFGGSEEFAGILTFGLIVVLIKGLSKPEKIGKDGRKAG